MDEERRSAAGDNKKEAIGWGVVGMSWGGQHGVGLDDNVRRVVDVCVVWWHLFLHHEDGRNFERTMFSQIWPNTMNQDFPCVKRLVAVYITIGFCTLHMTLTRDPAEKLGPGGSS